MRRTTNQGQNVASNSLRANNRPATTSMLKVKVKHKVVSIYVIKAYRDNRPTSPLILIIGSSWRSSLTFTFWPLYLRKISSSNHSVGVPVSTITGPHVLEKSVLSLPGIETRIVQLKA